MAKNRDFISKNDEKEPDYVKKSHNNLICYVDSSFDEKRKICGIGIVIQKGQKQKTYSIWTPANTNNWGELYACYMAGILVGGEKASIYSDSQCALSYINNNINNDKPRERWKWEEHQRMRLLAYKIRKLGNNLTFEKVKGHTRRFNNNAMGNEMADVLSRYGRTKYYNLDKSKSR